MGLGRWVGCMGDQTGEREREERREEGRET